jgi:hypothetical protein
VNVPDPTLGPNGQPQVDTSAVKTVSSSVLQAAFQACQSQLATARALEPRRPDVVPQQVKFAECMRQHGVTNFPDPDPSGSGFGQRISQAGIDVTSPAFQGAQQSCQALLPSGGAG